MCLLCGQSLSSAHTYTQAEAVKMNGHLHVDQPRQVFAHEEKRSHGRTRFHHKAIFQRIVGETCLSSTPFLANLYWVLTKRARRPLLTNAPC